jgi:hypothetical protein
MEKGENELKGMESSTSLYYKSNTPGFLVSTAILVKILVA